MDKPSGCTATPCFPCGCGRSFKNSKALALHGRTCDYCTPEVKLWAKVDKNGPGGCWLWLGALNSDGYGHFQHEGRQVYGHRYIYELYRGPIPPRMRALHRCDCPSCVNPDHIFLGTQLDNMQDAMQKRRHAHGERSIHAKPTEAQVREIRALKGRATDKELGVRYGVGRGTIGAIWRGYSWRYV